ncbi:DUF4249 domain-containing protein [Fibrella sp. HMF5335]|uniref:DUF4249 domain-containing protein n=1 Tax=Fibrella rubiginis TaxID=2817060 RepID=A0A939K3U2_9BACT|nr:DUF4249 domain-containing protein [Fibrella rubiginis]MBO0935486.1 DUF4249 domain-containing protein [Fibrella rubiginis]
MQVRQYSLIGLLGLLLGCVSTYDPDLALNSRLVVVSGTITDLADQQTVTLNQSRSSQDSVNVSTPISNALVEVIVNGAETVLLTETQPGTYVLPVGFRGKVGNTYQLRFRTSEGAQYASSVEEMTTVPAISRAYDEFTLRGPKTTADGLPIPANDIYIDFADPAATRNFYLWRWRLYETQAWCATCQQGRYVLRDIGPVGSGPIEVIGCVPDSSLSVRNLFDYTCRGNCWDIFYNSDIDVFADTYTNGQRQVGHKVASIPVYQRDPALIVVEQLSLSANAYRYYKLFADQVQNTGTLADAPPAPISGNVKNRANPAENVIGYFAASSVAVNRYKINRQNVTSTGKFQGLFYAQNGRVPNVEVPKGETEYGKGLPSALCVPGRYRTDQLPPGWNQ